jgi:F-type H+-transporting ATPase subunit b
MQQLFSQLGIDWRLILSQAANFLVLFAVLWFLLYKPLLKLLADRRKKIEEGIVKAEMADARLLEANETSKEKIKEAELAAQGIIRKTEGDAKVLEAKLLAKAKEKETAELADFQGILRSKEDASRRALDDEAKKLVKMAIAKTVALSPESIDDALIARAIKEVKQTG